MVETSFLVVPFDHNTDGNLRPGSPVRLDTEEAAEFAAQQVAEFHAGLAIIEDPADEFGEPRLLAIFGRISDETFAIFGAATRVRKCGRLFDQAWDFVTRVASGNWEAERAASCNAAISRKKRALRALTKSSERRVVYSGTQL